MMKTEIVQNGAEALVRISGRLDTTTAPQLEQETAGLLAQESRVVLDLAELEYISSAGLRVLLKLHKGLTDRGGLTVKNVNEIVSEVFEVTGFDGLLNIE